MTIRKLGAEFILGIMILPFVVWTVSSIYSIEAKADRVTAIESKVDYIYQYLVEKNGSK